MRKFNSVRHMRKFQAKSWQFVFSFFLGLAYVPAIQAVELGPLRKALFKIEVISQEPDLKQPWNLKEAKSSSGTGFYVGKAGILTNAHVVAFGKFISVLKDGDDEPVSARVKFIAHDCDLALLEVEDPKYFDGVPPFEFGEIPDVRETVNTVGYPTGGEQLSITQGVVSRISYRRYVHSGDDMHLLVQVDSAINPGNSGGPVVKGRKAVGVAFQANSSAENTGYIIPTPVIQRFLKDIQDGHYDGHPIQGFGVQEGALQNEATRRYHGLKLGEGGVKVSEVSAFSPLAGRIQSGDILLAIEGLPIGVDGKVNFFGDRLSFRVVYDLKQKKESIPFEILRQGKRLKIPIPLTAQTAYYESGHVFSKHPRFVVYAGLVFSALSRDYLETWGRTWMFDAPTYLRYIHQFYYEIDEFTGHRDVIVLSEKLAHPVNNFAGPFMDLVLSSINDRKIQSLEDLKDALAKAEGEQLVFRFWKEPVPFVVSREEANLAHAEIVKNYKVSMVEFLNAADDGANAGWELEKN